MRDGVRPFHIRGFLCLFDGWVDLFAYDPHPGLPHSNRVDAGGRAFGSVTMVIPTIF